MRKLLRRYATLFYIHPGEYQGYHPGLPLRCPDGADLICHKKKNRTT